MEIRIKPLKMNSRQQNHYRLETSAANAEAAELLHTSNPAGKNGQARMSEALHSNLTTAARFLQKLELST